jgi:hypothetical protein
MRTICTVTEEGCAYLSVDATKEMKTLNGYPRKNIIRERLFTGFFHKW